VKIIAFDLGSTSAYAHNCGERIVTAARNFDGLRPKRLHEFSIWLEEVFSPGEGLELDAVIYERPFARGLHATRSLWGMAGVLEGEATYAGYPVLDMPPSSIKKFATGKGNADKAEMLVAAKMMGYTGENEHEADAFCLLQYAVGNVIKDVK